MALQHLRSSTANKRPLPAGMSDGQLAINTNAASPGLFFKDSSGNLVKTGPVHVGTTAPNASPASGGATGNSTGELWLDTSVSPAQMKVWDGSQWVGIVADELPVSKLQDGAARQLLQTDAAGTGVEWTSNVDVPGTLDVTSTATFDSIAQHPVGSAAAPTITFTGDTNTGIYSPGADQLALSTNGVQRINIEADGDINIDSGGVFYDATNNRLAIGTTSPQQLLHLSAGAEPTLRIENTDTTSEADQVLGAIEFRNNDVSGTAAGITGKISAVFRGTAGETDLDFSAGSTANFSRRYRIGWNGDHIWSAFGAERARIDTSGRLLVGTSTASTAGNPLLQVNGSVSKETKAGTINDGATISLFTADNGRAYLITTRQTDDVATRSTAHFLFTNNTGTASRLVALATGTSWTVAMNSLTVELTNTSGFNRAYSASILQLY